MGLTIKTFDVILNNMINWIKSNNSKITNFSVGSVSRTMLESIAVELESSYYQMYKAFISAVENSALNSFGFEKYPSVPSSGTITITFKYPISSAMTIPSGFRFYAVSSNNLIYFETTSDNLIPVGSQSVDMLIQCTQPGKIGNVSAGSIKSSMTNLEQIYSISNNEAFYNGKVEETPEELRIRFSAYVDTLAKGTNAALKYGCLTVPGVTGAIIIDGIGAVRIYAHNADGELPPDLRDAVVASLEDYRPAGIKVEILPVSKKTVNLTVYVQLTEDEDIDKLMYQQLILTSVILFLSQYTVSESVVISELISFIRNLDADVIYDVHISPSSNIVVQENELVRPDDVVVIVS